jgi:hypothetical protein
VADGGGWDLVLAQGDKRAELTKVLKTVSLLLRNQFGPFQTKQLAGTDLQYPQHILTAVAGHS